MNSIFGNDLRPLIPTKPYEAEEEKTIDRTNVAPDTSEQTSTPNSISGMAAPTTSGETNFSYEALAQAFEVIDNQIDEARNGWITGNDEKSIFQSVEDDQKSIFQPVEDFRAKEKCNPEIYHMLLCHLANNFSKMEPYREGIGFLIEKANNELTDGQRANVFIACACNAVNIKDDTTRARVLNDIFDKGYTTLVAPNARMDVLTALMDQVHLIVDVKEQNAYVKTAIEHANALCREQAMVDGMPFKYAFWIDAFDRMLPAERAENLIALANDSKSLSQPQRLQLVAHLNVLEGKPWHDALEKIVEPTSDQEATTLLWAAAKRSTEADSSTTPRRMSVRDSHKDTIRRLCEEKGLDDLASKAKKRYWVRWDQRTSTSKSGI